MTSDMQRDDAIRLLAVQVLLEQPEQIPDTLEVELYAYRDTIHACEPIDEGAERTA